MKSYDAVVTREGRWWMIEIPELDGLTQARRLDEVERMAREYIAVTTDVPLSQVAVEISGIEVAGQDLVEAKTLVEGLRRRAQELEALVADLTREVASVLTDADVPVRDVSTVLGVSHQRVSQLVQAASEGGASDLARLVRAASGEYAHDLVVNLKDGRSLRIVEVVSPEKAKDSKKSRPRRAAMQDAGHAATRNPASARTSRGVSRSAVAGRSAPKKESLNNS
jgi:predicted XRE-type DNA-binding protein